MELLHFSHLDHVSLVQWTNHLPPATGGSHLRRRGVTHTFELGLPRWMCICTGQNPRRHVVFIEIWPNAYNNYLSQTAEVILTFTGVIYFCRFGIITWNYNILNYKFCYKFTEPHIVCGNHINRNVPPPEEKLTERYKQIDRISSKVCTYCTQLAGFFKDDTSPWVLYSIHIQQITY
jgi:hypothetical protein